MSLAPTPLRVADLACAGFIVVFFASMLIAFGVHTARGHRVRYERIDRQGSSRLLNKSFMEMAYWSLQSLGRGLAHRGITPNTVSYASLVLGAGAGVALAFGLFGVAALLTLWSGFLDLLDGLVARALGVASASGEVVDAAIDRYTEYLFFGGLVLYYRTLPALAVLAFVAMVGSSMVTYSTAKAEALQASVPSAMMRRHERTTYLVGGACLSAFSVMWLEPRLGIPPVGLPMLAALAFIAVLANVAAVRRLRTIAIAVAGRPL